MELPRVEFRSHFIEEIARADVSNAGTHCALIGALGRGYAAVTIRNGGII